MTERREFDVPGEPRGKMRPIASASHGHARLYQAKEQTEYENWIRLCYDQRYKGEEPFKKPIEATVLVYMGVPESLSGRKKSRMLSGEIAPTKKPDLDNVIKCLDALNGIAFEDDKLITSIKARKAYSSSPRVTFILEPTGEERS